MNSCLLLLPDFLQAPEVYDGKLAAADAYAFAMTFYVAMTGLEVFPGLDEESVKTKVKAGERPDISRFPLEWQKIISACWHQGWCYFTFFV